MGRNSRQRNSAVRREPVDLSPVSTQQETLVSSNIQQTSSPTLATVTTAPTRRSPRTKTRRTSFKTKRLQNQQIMTSNDNVRSLHQQHEPEIMTEQMLTQRQTPRPLLSANERPIPRPPNVPEAFIQLLKRRGWQTTEIETLLAHESIQSWEPAPQPLPDEAISPALRDYQMQLWLLQEMNGRVRWADEFRARGFR